MTDATPLAAGQQAPDFELKDQTQQPVRLSDYRGKKAVVVAFVPFPFTSICTAELCGVRDELPAFANDDVQVLAISTASAPTHKAWAEAEGYTFPVLSDFWPHGEVARAYGVFHDGAGAALRGTFVIDRDGVVTFSEVNGFGEERDRDGWRAALADLGVDDA